MSHCRIVPPYLLARLAASHPDEYASACGRQTLVIDARLRQQRTAAPPATAPTLAGGAPFAIHSAGNGSDLPGPTVRTAGDPPSGDAAVDEAYAGVDATLAMFRESFARSSYDGQGAAVVATVHYERDYDNAFWDGSQLVFGDGDGRVFERFTKPVDVLGHEFTHAVTQYTAGLTYQGQSGALNESVSDVFASCLKQMLLGQSAAQADWLIGEGVFAPSVRGRALRSMKEPGTAYDDPTIGKDPQVATMADYVDTPDDNGGVHLNSGIPNRAFALAATAIGGTSWEGAGQIWYTALTSGIGADTDFAGFAAATVAAARVMAPSSVDAVTTAWEQVGVSGHGGQPAPSHQAPDLVVVTRSGGFAGLRQSAELMLGDDPRTPEVESLLGRIDLRGVPPHQPQPDRFVYTFRLGGEEVVVGEQDLTPELAELATLILDT